tara:strand:- start:10 stop:354 length:345 start_codon:yes stop_codon:yes gene_type:complete
METLPAETREMLQNPAPIHMQPPLEEERPRQRRRTATELTYYIDEIDDEAERNFTSAIREHNRLRNGAAGGNACLASRLKKRLGAAHPDYIAAYAYSRNWARSNPRPRRSQFTN